MYQRNFIISEKIKKTIEYRYLENSGLNISTLSFDSWGTFHTQVNVSQAYNLIKTTFEAELLFLIMLKFTRKEIPKLLWVRSLKKRTEIGDLILSTKIF